MINHHGSLDEPIEPVVSQILPPSLANWTRAFLLRAFKRKFSVEDIATRNKKLGTKGIDVL